MFTEFNYVSLINDNYMVAIPSQEHELGNMQISS